MFCEVLPSHQYSRDDSASTHQCHRNHEEEEARVRAEVGEEELLQDELQTAPAKLPKLQPHRRSILLQVNLRRL